MNKNPIKLLAPDWHAVPLCYTVNRMTSGNEQAGLTTEWSVCVRGIGRMAQIPSHDSGLQKASGFHTVSSKAFAVLIASGFVSKNGRKPISTS